jgi:D-sedoheptulose 7-phosphate isomerase
MATLRDQTTTDRIRERLLARNEISGPFFEEEAVRLAHACRRMAARFEEGGRLLAFGRCPCASDAQHVSVEFVHPVIVGNGRFRRST